MSARPLNDAERGLLLQPCACGHTLNDHGSTQACWLCGDEGRDCDTDFEALLVERVAELVHQRIQEADHG